MTLDKLNLYNVICSIYTSSSYRALQPVQDSDLLNYFLPTISILCYFLPIEYIHALYIYQNVIFPMCFSLPIDLLDMGFHLLIFCTISSSAMSSTWPNQFNLCFLINPITFCPFNILLISWLVLILQ